MITTGRLPIRAPGVDQGLPTDGRGNHEWRGFIKPREHPQGIVRSGVLNNWNNKPARGFPASDDQWAYGALGRVDLLNQNTAKRRKHTLATLTGAMNAAATQDVRAMTFVPLLAEFLKGSAAPSPRAARMLELLEDWRAQGGSRLDVRPRRAHRPSRRGHPRHGLEPAGRRRAGAGAGPAAGRPARRHAAPALRPAAQRAVRRLAHVHVEGPAPADGQAGRGPLANSYCGLGDADVCRADLWAALEAAGVTLEAAQGADPAAWRADANRERIRFLPGLLPYTMRYTNRPSGIQQVIEFRGHRR